MSKAVEIGSTLGVVAVFLGVIVASGSVGLEKAGSVLAILLFVLLSLGAGYLVANETY